MTEAWVIPDWPAPHTVRALTTTRSDGFSKGPYASMNPADHVGDDPAAVDENRSRLVKRLQLPCTPCWLRQVHGTRMVEASIDRTLPPEADGVWCQVPGAVCAVLTADCLPLLLCDRNGHRVAAVHAGWRGLAAGVVEQAVAALQRPGEELMAWLGPAISAAAYVVGDEVRDAFLADRAEAAAAFQPAVAGGWHADLYLLARQRLAGSGVAAVYGGEFCTYRDRIRFFSYRRDGATGRMASLIWLQPQGEILPGD